MAIAQPEPGDWTVANAQQLRLSDAEVLRMLRDSFNRINKQLKALPADKAVTRAQLERTRQLLLAEQAKVFERLGDLVNARRLRSASRAAKLSAQSSAALLDAAGATSTADDLYQSLLATSQAGIQAAMARMGLSALPLSQRIYNVRTWMDGRLNRLINATLATGLNAKKFAKEARDWFNPNTPGGVRYAALRLARTEINNAFHAITVQKAIDTPWVPNMSWHLSKSHPKKDECNVIAEFNGGVYASEKVPVRPHPQCMCYVVPEPIEEDDFVENFLAGDYDDFLDKELAKEDARNAAETGEPPSEQTALATVTPIRPEAEAPERPMLRGDDALASIPKGLPKRGSLQPKQRAALKSYESANFVGINSFLRRDVEAQESSEVSIEKTVATIDSAMTQSVLPSDVEAWRGIGGADRIFGDLLNGDLTGFGWKELAFSSTSTEERVARSFANDSSSGGHVLMRVEVPAGAQGLQLSESYLGNQAELLLQRNTEWKVMKDHGLDRQGVRRLDIAVTVPKRDERSGANEGTDERGLLAANPQPAAVAAQADSPAIADRPPLADFTKRRFGNRLFGANNDKMESALANGPAANFEAATDELVKELQGSTYLHAPLEFFQAVDEEKARRTGETNTHDFERQAVQFLTTPEGVEAARAADRRYAEELDKLKDVDALSRAAKVLNGNQPDLPADSATFKPIEPADAQRRWDAVLASKPLNEDEGKGLRYYSTSPGYQAMNRLLRGLSITDKERTKAEPGARDTRNALRPNPEPMLVTRVTGAQQFAEQGAVYQRPADLVGLTGKRFKDSGFTSTAAQGGRLSSSGDVQMEIEVPAGVPFAYMEKLTRHKGENEILLSDGLEFQVLRSEWDPKTKRTTMRVRVVDWPGRS
jgi:hypothetical protein